MGDTVTTLNALMAEKFYPNVIRSFATEPVLMMMFAKVGADEINQRAGRLPIQTRRQGSFAGGSENQTMPAEVNGAWDKFVPSLKAVYSTGGFSGFTQWQTGINDVNAPANKLKLGGMLGEKVAAHLEDFKHLLEQTIFRDGKGKVADAITARTTGALGTATVDPTTSNWAADTFHIAVGTRVNFYDASGNIHNQSAAVPVSTVTAVNDTTGVVTFDTVPTDAAVGDFMVYEGSWDLLPNGMAGLVQSQNITLQNIDVTNLPNMKSPTFTASAAFDIRFVNRMQTRSKKWAGVKRPVNDFIIVTHPKETDAYRNAGYALSSVVDSPNRASKTLDLAYDRVQISGMDIYESNHCGERDLFGIRLSAFQRYEVYAPNLLSLTGDDQYLFPIPVSTGTYKHQLQFYMAFYGNLLIKQPAACFRITSLDKTNLG